MARVLDPFMSGKAKGSVGGMTATSTGAGSVMKRKARPPRRRRGVQPKIRSILGWCARQYGSLTSGQRDEWEAYATNHPQPDGFGGTFILTPEQAYLMLNVVAVRIGGSAKLQTSPPTDPPVASVLTLVAADGAASGEVELTWTMLGSPSAEDSFDTQRAGPFQSQGRVEIHSRYRDTIQHGGGLLTYTYEDLVPEMYYWFRVRYVDQYGQVTNWVIVQHKAPTVP